MVTIITNKTYTQIGQAFSYNDGTFTFNYLENPSSTWINHLVEVNNPNGSNDTYQLFTLTTKGPSQYLNKTVCFWRQRTSNGDIYPGRQSNGTCTPTFEPDTSSDAIPYKECSRKNGSLGISPIFLSVFLAWTYIFSQKIFRSLRYKTCIKSSAVKTDGEPFGAEAYKTRK